MRTLRLLSLLGAAAVLVLSAGRALAHLRDLSGVHHVTGVWMALARYANDGVLYPPLDDGGWYAGTRYMPLCFLAVAGLARLVGDYLLAAKLMALGSTAALLAAVLAAGRRAAGRWPEALTLTGLVLAAPEGLAALRTPHADALASALAVAGLLVVGRGPAGAARLGLAAVLFALALWTKFSAVAGPAAAVLFLWRRDRRGAVGLLLAWLAFTAAGLALLEWLSDGRFADNLRSLGSGGMDPDSVRLGPARVAFALRQQLPFAAVLALAVLALPRPGLWEGYFACSAGVTLVIFTSPGTCSNHLLELEVAAVLVVGGLLQPQADAARPLALAVTLAVLLIATYGHIYRYFDGEEAAATAREVTEALPAGGRLLAEDATVPVLLGRRPVVMDPFAFRLLAGRGRVDDGALAGRVARREFDVLVLMARVDRPGESLCPHFHFGPRVTDAMRTAYRFDRRAGPYYLFVPDRDRDDGGPAPPRPSPATGEGMP